MCACVVSPQFHANYTKRWELGWIKNSFTKKLEGLADRAERKSQEHISWFSCFVFLFWFAANFCMVVILENRVVLQPLTGMPFSTDEWR